MEIKDSNIVSEIRSFNRFYTNILGLLNKGILNSPYSLTEVRILLEISKLRNCTAIMLIEKLDIDRGYMSRILNRFEADGMITKRNSHEDGRMVFIYLTSKGIQVLSELEEKSNCQIRKLIGHLSEMEQVKIVEAMKYIKKSLLSNVDEIQVRAYLPKDVEYIIKRHRELYETEYSFSSEFGDYVEKYVLKFDESHDETKENIWMAEINNRPVGVIAIVKADASSAQLRWFLVEPEFRGMGLGHRLMQTAIDFSIEKGYKSIFLWTVDILGTARHLYKNYGFELAETVDNDTWTGGVIKEERWVLNL